MSGHNRKTDVSVIIAVALIGFGFFALLNQVGGEAWQQVRYFLTQTAGRVIWPLALIGLGVFVLVGARRGAFSNVQTGGKRLYRSRSDRVIGGVLGGFGNWIGWDPTWVRIGYVLLAVVTGFWTGAVIYVIAMIVIPEEPVEAPQQPSWPQDVGTPAPPPPPTWTQAEPGSTETVQQPPAPPAPPAS